jgi:hypothetical protein
MTSIKRHTRYYSTTLYLAQVLYTTNLAVPCDSHCEITMTTELRFCEHFTCLSSKIQNAIKLENISSLITSPFSYQCICRKTRLVHFVIHGRHISMECMIPKCKFSKQLIKKYLVTEYLFITEGEFLRTKNTL